MQKCGLLEFRYNKSDISGVMLDFTFSPKALPFLFSSSVSHFFPTSTELCELISNYYINVSIYISSENDTHTHAKKREKVNIIYRLDDCICLSSAYKTTSFFSCSYSFLEEPMRTEPNYGGRVVNFSRFDSLCLVKRKLLLQHMDW